jgi:hypothetical protein
MSEHSTMKGCSKQKTLETTKEVPLGMEERRTRQTFIEERSGECRIEIMQDRYVSGRGCEFWGHGWVHGGHRWIGLLSRSLWLLKSKA